MSALHDLDQQINRFDERLSALEKKVDLLHLGLDRHLAEHARRLTAVENAVADTRGYPERIRGLERRVDELKRFNDAAVETPSPTRPLSPEEEVFDIWRFPTEPSEVTREIRLTLRPTGCGWLICEGDRVAGPLALDEAVATVAAVMLDERGERQGLARRMETVEEHRKRRDYFKEQTGTEEKTITTRSAQAPAFAEPDDPDFGKVVVEEFSGGIQRRAHDEDDVRERVKRRAGEVMAANRGLADRVDALAKLLGLLP